MRNPAFTRRSLGASAFLALSVSFLSACGSSSASGATLKFTAIPDENATELRERYGKVAEYLSDELGISVEYVPTTNYDASVESFKNGDIHLAWFGGLTGAQARAAVDGARAIAQGKVDPKFKSYFVANASTGIQPSSEFPMAMEGKTFTFGDPKSTSGRLMPEYFIRQNTGKSPTEFFGHPDKFAMKHDVTAKQVEAGTVDCGALNYKTYDDMVAKGQLDPAKCVKVWTTPEYADYNWTAHPAIDEIFEAGVIDKLQAALVAMEDPELLEALQRTEGLIPATNEDFAGIAELARELDLLGG